MIFYRAFIRGLKNMSIKKNIILFSFLSVLCAQASIPKLVKTPRSKVVSSEVVISSNIDSKGNSLWVKHTIIKHENGNIDDIFEYFPTEVEAVQGRWNKASQAKALPAEREEPVGIDETDSDDFLPFPMPKPTAVPTPKTKVVSTRKDPSGQPAQPSQVQKIHLSNKQILSAAQEIYDQLVLQFTGSMTAEEVAALMKKNNFENYDDATFEQITQTISNVLQDMDCLADDMCQKLQEIPNFKVGLKDTIKARVGLKDTIKALERYLKNYLRMINQKQYISDDLTQALMNRFVYKKLKQDKFLKYAKELYLNLMQQRPEIDWSKDVEEVRKSIINYFYQSKVPNIIEMKKRFPMIIIQNNLQAKDDFNEIIDWVAKKIVLPPNRPSEDLGIKLEQQIFQQQLEQAQSEKDRLEGAMLKREAALKGK